MESEGSATDQHIEYVELLDSDVYDQENTPEMIEIQDESNPDAGGMMHEIVTIADEDDVNMLENYEEIQYVEAEIEVGEQSLLNHENHTIFIHDGRKYVISNDQLTNGNQTIILDEEDGQLIHEEQDNPEEITEHIEENDEPQMYYTSNMETEEDASNELVGRQFAVLKDGKLHLTNIEDGNTEIRHFESTLTNYEELNDEANETLDDEEDDKQLSEITGKNLITGQTISLSGILEKMRRKTNVNELLNINAKQPRNTTAPSNPQPQDYILVPPVTRRVVVGRTQDGKRLVGRILQIQKKIQPNDVKISQSSQNTFSITMPTKRTAKPRRKEQLPERKEKHSNEKKSNQIMQLRYLSRSVLDENVARTLAGLMDLESINKRLKGRRLIVRHIQRRSREGKIITGSKKIAYYCGRLKRQSAADNWTFVQEHPAKGFDENGIDLPDNDDNSDKVNLRLSEDGRSILCEGNADDTDTIKTDYVDTDETDETLTLYLTETQDEFGKKKTKVTIPQIVATNQTRTMPQRNVPLNEDYLCKYCGKKFQTLGSLKRHATVHDHSLRPLQCLTCLGRFTDESSLKKHMLLHTGLRPHKCHLCEKSFAHRGDLNFHLRTHDPVKRYECNVCKKQFNRHSNMLRHAEIHRPSGKTPDKPDNEGNQSIIILNALNEEYENSNTETETEATSAKSAPYTCDQCGIQYNFSSSLTRHIVNVHLKQTDQS